MAEGTTGAPASTPTPTPTTGTPPPTTPTAEPQKSDGPLVDVPDADDFVPTKWNRKQAFQDVSDDEGVDTTGENDDAVDPQKTDGADEGQTEGKDKEFKPTGELHTIKVDQKEIQLTTEQLIERAQKGAAAEKRMAEAAKLKKQVSNVLHWLKKDPMKVLLDPALGYKEEDVRNMVEKWLYEKVKYESMSDEEKEAFDNKKELKRLKEKEEIDEKTKTDQELEKLTGQYKEHYEQKIIEGMEASGLPKNAYVAGRVAYYMLEGLKRKMKLEPSDAAALVKEELRSHLGHFLNETSDDQLLEFLGDDVAKKVSKHQVKKLKEKGVKTPEKQGEPHRRPYKPKKKMSMQEWKEKNRRMMMDSD